MKGWRYERTVSRQLDLDWSLLETLHDYVTERADVRTFVEARLANGDKLIDTSPSSLAGSADHPVTEVTLSYSTPVVTTSTRALFVLVIWSTGTIDSEEGLVSGIRAFVGGPRETEVLALITGLEDLVDRHLGNPLAASTLTGLGIRWPNPSVTQDPNWYRHLLRDRWFIAIASGVIVLIVGLLILGS